ncbi:MAG: AAA family ATPase [Ideonella sp. MAG2]|nr:MAG: AAA family ATPase [Ideonella sp. MAG2]
MSTSNALTLSGNPALPVARMRQVYREEDVARKMAKLPAQEHDALRAVYERMLDKGAQRFQVKPSGLPAMQHLYDELPNFHEVLDDVKRQLALCDGSGDALEITPMLLLGPPGIGKTHFARELSELLGTGMGFMSMSSLTAGWLLSGASSQWKGAKPGKVFETLVDGDYANPVMVVDEIDKARAEQAYDPLGSLYSLLEHDTAKAFVMTGANTSKTRPEPILNRMNVFEVEMPDFAAARSIAQRLYASIRSEHDWGKHFEDKARDDVLDTLAAMAPREMRRAWMTAFGNARLAQRDSVQVADLPACQARKHQIGFMH